MSQWPVRGALIALNALVWTSACSSLPAFAAPSGGAVDPNSVDRSDWITYRPLTRADFKADSPPAESAEHAEKLGAMTCSYLVTTPETKAEILEERTAEASSFTASLSELSFIAYMDRGCSWWNPKEGAAPEEYLLQHEQTHFALTELAARKLNTQAKVLQKGLTFTEDSLEEARGKLSAEVESILTDAHETLLDENLEFDEETSAQHDPVAQQKWADKVAEELSKFPSK